VETSKRFDSNSGTLSDSEQKILGEINVLLVGLGGLGVIYPIN